MSRSGYYDDLDQADFAMWRGQVMSAARGKRGQALIRDLCDALDAMSVRRLVAHDLLTQAGEVCALGCVGQKRGVTRLEDIDVDDEDHHDDLATELNISSCLVREIEWVNDEGAWDETPEQRWERVRRWCDRMLSRKKGSAALAHAPPG